MWLKNDGNLSRQCVCGFFLCVGSYLLSHGAGTAAAMESGIYREYAHTLKCVHKLSVRVSCSIAGVIYALLWVGLGVWKGANS